MYCICVVILSFMEGHKVAEMYAQLHTKEIVSALGCTPRRVSPVCQGPRSVRNMNEISWHNPFKDAKSRSMVQYGKRLRANFSETLSVQLRGTLYCTVQSIVVLHVVVRVHGTVHLKHLVKYCMYIVHCTVNAGDN